MFDEWVAAAKSELTKRAKRYAMQESAYQAQPYHHKPYQKANGHKKYIHPNDRTVPMDVDEPFYTKIRCAYTEKDKRLLSGQGKCFYCEKNKDTSPMTAQGKDANKGHPHTEQKSSLPFKRKTLDKTKPRTGFRKFNKSRSPPYTPKA